MSVKAEWLAAKTKAFCNVQRDKVSLCSNASSESQSNAYISHCIPFLPTLTGSKVHTKTARVCDLLVAHYGNVISDRTTPPIDELVLTILSQNTNDRNSRRAYDNLKAKYSSWEDVLSASEADLGEVIRSSGSFRLKAKRIKAALAEIVDRVGRLDLSLLKDMGLQEATQWLTSIYGVGPKTAAIVLLFSFGKPTLPVDTHVWRVSKRLGLIPESASRIAAQKKLETLVPNDCVFSLNHNLVIHGRQVCRAQQPLCEQCFLSALCDWFLRRRLT
jgi:endonuclease-3